MHSYIIHKLSQKHYYHTIRQGIIMLHQHNYIMLHNTLNYLTLIELCYDNVSTIHYANVIILCYLNVIVTLCGYITSCYTCAISLS